MAKKPSNVVRIIDVWERNRAARCARAARQMDKIFDDLESDLPIGPKERIAAVYTWSRIEMIFYKLHQGAGNVAAGSAVRKYAGAFQNAARGRKAAAGLAAPTIDDDDDEPDAA